MNESCCPLLQLDNVCAAYDAFEVLHGIDLPVPEGQMLGILGPNGSGKSTLLRVIAGLLPPSAGHIYLQGKDLSQYSARQRARFMAFVPQSVSLAFAFTVFDVVAMGRHPYVGLLGSLSKEDYEIIHQALEQTHCTDLQERAVTELSGGELQRVIIARALAQEPRILLLDEPTAHLDVHHQLDIAHLLQRLNREQNITILWVSHDINLAAEFCERLVILHEGRIFIEGKPDDVIKPAYMEQIYSRPLPITLNPLSGRPQIIISGVEE